MTSVTEDAPAKVNLALHVTGQRADGYHLIDSLVVFLDIGDRVTLSPGSGFAVTGPFAPDVPTDGDNLCLRALDLAGLTGRVELEKNLPVASGLGGGSADAAAVLRAGGQVPSDPVRLGADLPVCLLSKPCRMGGIGEVLSAAPDMPVLHLVLVNPGVPVSTPAVYAALTRRDNSGLPPYGPDFMGWLAQTRNDLQPPAIAMTPVISDVLAALEGAGADLVRMSGSGATCFGLFRDAVAASDAAVTLGAVHPDWWVKAARTIQGLPSATRRD
ncbi:MAG: 4-(cytidine 5'-diphospho)-2-C-methyl-D-erythritol kinase [Paracoccus denitrificans]|nr:MAG: 4-(cytidine 5'-diphospho)-2-C-methyl-D-erythritol kinase [Paracoccus denitrificans]PZO83142.1 MAG: 4-(cytidine 5'-diphospho)-2-C-methyl-D-erythritol kinase [Paracoccus denitrificans]